MAYLWVKEADYAEFRAGTDLPDTYRDFLAETRELEELARERGLTPMAISISPLEFEAWCRKKGKVMNGQARSEYAAYRVKLQKKN